MKKKLCYFVNSAWYFELHWLDRANAAITSGYEVSLIAKFHEPEILKRMEILGIKCYESNIEEKGVNPLVFLYDVIKAFRILNKINPDVLHCITIKPGVISCLWCKYKNKKLIYSFVGLGRVFESKRIYYNMIRFVIVSLYKYLFSGLNCKVIFEHKSDQRKIIDLVGLDEDKTVVIDGAGIDIDHFAYCEEPKKGKPKILFASRMLWSKGLADLLQARELLKLKGCKTDFEILVAGIIIDNDNDAISYAQIQRWNDSGEIKWLGTRNDIKEIIQECNIIALPSVYAEGIPRILLEAGSVGRSTIAYDIGGCNSLIKDGVNGVIVDIKNIGQLADKIQYLINNPESRYQMGLNARKIIESKYSSDIIIKETLRLYLQ